MGYGTSSSSQFPLNQLHLHRTTTTPVVCSLSIHHLFSLISVSLSFHGLLKLILFLLNPRKLGIFVVHFSATTQKPALDYSLNVSTGTANTEQEGEFFKPDCLLRMYLGLPCLKTFLLQLTSMEKSLMLRSLFFLLYFILGNYVNFLISVLVFVLSFDA